MGLIRTIRRYLDGKRNSRHTEEDGDYLGLAVESPDLFLDLRTLEVATNSFSVSNKLGHGGFGSVYKGLMPNGQVIAVKKLFPTGRQGVREFTNEVKLLTEIKHKNLVTLLGCCVEGPQKMLVYEYLPNKSLDCFLFGVARGLLYLHEEAPMRILHRDIKASNILLDEKLSPKISDFGLARLFPEEDTHVNTFRISGTHGYMAPEYAMYGDLSIKIDVFSFGILLLEIISGRRIYCSGFIPDHAGLLNSAWKLHQAGNALDIVDPSLDDNYNADEVGMCRPDMNLIHVMLSSIDLFTLPEPGLPALLGRPGSWTSTTSRGTTSASTNTNPSTTESGLNGSYGGNSTSVEVQSQNSI